MNRLGKELRGQVISCLVEGTTIGLTAQITGVAKNTVVKLLIDLGAACSQYLDRTLRSLPCKVIEYDEVWSFGYSSTKNDPIQPGSESGIWDVWTWTAIDTETKLVPSWLVGRRDERDCDAFLSDLRSRIAVRGIQLTTSGMAPYPPTTESFSSDQPDHTMLIKVFEGGDDDLRDSPSARTGIEHPIITGGSDPERIATSYAVRNDLTMRIGMHRDTFSSNAFLRKVENHAAAISLHFMFYNFALPYMIPSNVAGPRARITPAMAAGLANHVWSVWEIAELLK